MKTEYEITLQNCESKAIIVKRLKVFDIFTYCKKSVD